MELSREVAQLRAKRLAEGSKRLMRLRGAAVARMAQMAQGEGGGELQAALDDYSRRFGPDSEVCVGGYRQPARCPCGC